MTNQRHIRLASGKKVEDLHIALPTTQRSEKKNVSALVSAWEKKGQEDDAAHSQAQVEPLGYRSDTKTTRYSHQLSPVELRTYQRKDHSRIETNQRQFVDKTTVTTTDTHHQFDFKWVEGAARNVMSSLKQGASGLKHKLPRTKNSLRKVVVVEQSECKVSRTYSRAA